MDASRRPARRALPTGIIALAALLPVALASADVVAAMAADRTAAQAALSLARQAFDTYVLHRERLAVPMGLPELLQERSGAFVSAVKGDAPRCCMGSLYPTQATLAEEIIAAAVAAAGLDARQAPVQPGELAGLQLIVSIVGPPESLADPGHFDPVRDGIAARGPHRTGVVLPGETRRRVLAVRWARVRAGAGPNETVEYFRLQAFRIAEAGGRAS
jgi:AMMECR1 domain-containing protein